MTEHERVLDTIYPDTLYTPNEEEIWQDVEALRQARDQIDEELKTLYDDGGHPLIDVGDEYIVLLNQERLACEQRLSQLKRGAAVVRASQHVA